MAKFTIEAQLAADTWIDISDELHGKLGQRIVRTQFLHKQLKPVTNTCKITIFGSDRITDIFNYTPRDLPVRIFKDSELWFTGFVRGEVSATFRGGGIGTFEVVDRSYQLNDEIEVYLGTDADGQPWTEIPISTASDHTGIVNRVLIAQGVAPDEINALDIPQRLPRFAVSGDEGRIWNDIFERIMFEYGYALNVRANGHYEMFDLFPVQVQPIARIGNQSELEYSALSNISRVVSPLKHNSTRVIWYPQTIKEDMVLFELTQGARDNFRCWVEVSPGRFYPSQASETLAVYSIYQQIDGYKVISAYNQSFEWEQLARIPEGVDSFNISRIVLRMEEHHPLFSDIRLQAAALGDRGVITRYRIKGDAVVQDNLEEHRYISYGLEGSKNIYEYKADLIIDPTYARRLADGFTHWSIWGAERLTFEGVNFNLNEIYDIRDDTLTKVDGLYRVIQVVENDIERQTVTVERIPRGREIPG